MNPNATTIEAASPIRVCVAFWSVRALRCYCSTWPLRGAYCMLSRHILSWSSPNGPLCLGQAGDTEKKKKNKKKIVCDSRYHVRQHNSRRLCFRAESNDDLSRRLRLFDCHLIVLVRRHKGEVVRAARDASYVHVRARRHRHSKETSMGAEAL